MLPLYPIAAPCSASFLCLKALRYLVRSYVTRPTTINAITEIPAKTPRPIGNTDNFLPGSSKFAEADADASFWAAADADVVAEAAAAAAESLPDAVAAALVAPLLAEANSDDIAETATEETPLALIAAGPAAAEEEAAGAEVVPLEAAPAAPLAAAEEELVAPPEADDVVTVAVATLCEPDPD